MRQKLVDESLISAELVPSVDDINLLADAREVDCILDSSVAASEYGRGLALEERSVTCRAV